MSNFTPGPWVQRSEEIYTEDGDWVALIAADGLTDREQSNANLIAAAPELFEALAKVVQYIPTGAIDCGGMKCREPWCEACSMDADKAVDEAYKARDESKKALAKAEGKS